MKMIAVDVDKCYGCRLCELACSLKYAREFNPARSRIHVHGYTEVFCLPVTCFQCTRPYCIEVCPEDAIIKNKDTGVVKVLREKCTGCKMCTLACPFGNIAFSSEEQVVVKCELCDGAPECVAFCPTGALKFEEADTAMLFKQRALAEQLKAVHERV
ncbi:MAG: 4Fe-4S dicluster domain-containing protein [Chloroflexi bacterium]|nr:4Fe-4S dicluster domain-containing protein [Chloroflexota bacterium]